MSNKTLALVPDWANPNLKLVDYVPVEFHPMVHHHWHQFPLPNPMWWYLLATLYCALCVVSLTGNGIVLWIFMKTKTLRTPANMFVINLAFSDFMMMITQGPAFFISAFTSRVWVWGVLGCQLYGFFGGLFGIGSIMTMAFIAYDRYNVIVKAFTGARITHKKAALMILVAWLWSSAFNIPPWFGWSGFAAEGFLSTCTFDYLTEGWWNVSFGIYIFVGAYCLPLLIIVYCYFFIVKAVVSHEEQLREQAKRMNVQNLRANQAANAQSQEIRIAKVALANISLWVVMWSPYAAVVLVGLFGDRSIITPLVSQLPALIAKSASVYNPLVYAISHPKYRQALQEKLPWFCIHEPKDSDATSIATEMTDVGTTPAKAPPPPETY